MRKASEIQSKDVQIGDLIEILWTDRSKYWNHEAQDQIGQKYVVHKLNENYLPVELGNTHYTWENHEFKIIKTKEELEEESKPPVPVDTSKRHRHYEVIKSWIEDTSQVVEYRSNEYNKWDVIYNPMFNGQGEYRIKPKKQKVKVWQFLIRDKQDGELLLSTRKYCSPESAAEVLGEKFEILYKIPESEEEIEVDAE